jgi:hypothetical protein
MTAGYESSRPSAVQLRSVTIASPRPTGQLPLDVERILRDLAKRARQARRDPVGYNMADLLRGAKPR